MKISDTKYLKIKIMESYVKTTVVVILAHAFIILSVTGKRINRDLDLSGSMLPEEYPDGDVSSYALPIFIKKTWGHCARFKVI